MHIAPSRHPDGSGAAGSGAERAAGARAGRRIRLQAGRLARG
jgi:hypothetical protein